MKKKRKARLTPTEDATWVVAFEHYKGMGYTDKRADHLAWLDTQDAHPRLWGFDGCHAKVKAVK